MFSYENLIVYQKAFELNQKTYSFLRNAKLPSYMKNQLGRASLSIMLNIAEGSGKFGTKDRKNFFVISRGSIFECAALINFLYAENEIIPLLVNN